jgi:hypothetical protein
MRRRTNNFDMSMERTNNWIKRGFIAFACFFVLMLLIIFGIWGFIGYTAVKIVNDPSATGHTVGSFVGGIDNAFQESWQRQ